MIFCQVVKKPKSGFSNNFPYFFIDYTLKYIASMRTPNRRRAWEKRHSATFRDAFPMHLLIDKSFL